MKVLAFAGLVLTLALIAAAVFVGSDDPDGLQRVLEDFPMGVDPATLEEEPDRWRDLFLGAAGACLVLTAVLAWGALRRRKEG